MNSLESLKNELLLQKQAIESLGGKVIVANQNPSPAEITAGIKTIPASAVATASLTSLYSVDKLDNQLMLEEEQFDEPQDELEEQFVNTNQTTEQFNYNTEQSLNNDKQNSENI